MIVRYSLVGIYFYLRDDRNTSNVRFNLVSLLGKVDAMLLKGFVMFD